MVLVCKDMQITTLEDIQKLKVKDLREILRSNSEATGGIKADLVLKVYAILMRHVLRPGEYQRQSSDNTAQDHQNTTENSGDFKYDETLRQISALGWSTDLRQLPELNFIQLYDYLVVSTRKYRHIVLKGTNYKKLKSYQFFFEGNVKRLESKTHEDKTYVKASVLPSMKKSPYRVVVEFRSQSDVSCAAFTCPAGLRVRGGAIILEVYCLPWKTLQDGVYKNILKHYRAHRVFRYGWFHAIRALQPSLLIKS